MSSNLTKPEEVYIYYCPVCKHTRAVPCEQIKPGPVYCGKCHLDKRPKTEMNRDLIAEGHG